MCCCVCLGLLCQQLTLTFGSRLYETGKACLPRWSLGATQMESRQSLTRRPVTPPIDNRYQMSIAMTGSRGMGSGYGTTDERKNVVTDLSIGPQFNSIQIHLQSEAVSTHTHPLFRVVLPGTCMTVLLERGAHSHSHHLTSTCCKGG